MTRMPTIDEIARRAKVSKTTVSFVINSKPGVSQATAEHVRRIIEEMNYVPSALAQRFASRCSMAVALIAQPYPQVFSNAHHADMLDAVFSTLDAAGYALVLGTSGGRFLAERRYLTMLRSGQVDGLLLLEPTLDQDYLVELGESGSPVVVLNGDGERAGLDHVRTDDAAVGRMAAEHFLELGHRNIGVIAGSQHHASGRDRFVAFRDTLEKRGCPLEMKRIYHGQFEKSAWSGEQGCREILTASPETTAIFCSNDTMSVGALTAARDMGRAVPDTLTLMGVDGNPETVYSTPQITTIQQPSYEVAKQGTQILLSRLTTEADAAEHKSMHRVVAPELVVRESSGPPPK